jgi:hypothetical protein
MPPRVGVERHSLFSPKPGDDPGTVYPSCGSIPCRPSSDASRC